MFLISFLKNETKYLEIIFFFPTLKNKTKLIINRFRISSWKIQIAIWVQLSKFYILFWKHEWPLGCSFQNFVFHCKKPNGRMGIVFKIFHFAVQNEWPFGYNCKILYFPAKKPVALWVHALSSLSNICTFLLKQLAPYSIKYIQITILRKRF